MAHLLGFSVFFPYILSVNFFKECEIAFGMFAGHYVICTDKFLFLHVTD